MTGPTPAERATVETFLYEEAERLDDFRLREWLDLLAEDVTYRVPIRVTRERDASRSEFSETSFHFDEDYDSLATRIERFESEFAWSESPRTLTRRFVTNVRLEPVEGPLLAAKSNLQVVRRRHEAERADTITGERRDVLRSLDDGLELVERVVHLDHTTMETQNLSIFL